MANNNQLQEHQGLKGGKGDIPWDNVLEVLVVNFGARLFNGFVDGIVRELRTNRQSMNVFTHTAMSPNLVSFRIKMEAIQQVRTQGLLVFPGCFPDHRPNVSNSDPLFPCSFDHSLGVQLCKLEISVALPWRVPRC